MARVYVCYESSDVSYRDAFAGILKNQNTQIRDIPVIDKKNMRPKGKEEIKEYILEQMRDCAAIALLIGNNTHNAPVVQWELDVANAQGKKIIPIRIPNTTGGAPPLVKKLNKQIVEWDSNKIKNAINKAFGRVS